MKKYLNLILLGGALLLSLLVFATMAGTALSVTLWGVTAKSTVYDMIGGDSSYGLAVACLVLFLIGLVVEIALAVLEVLKKYNQFNHFIALGVAVLFFVTGILFFCFATGDYSSFSLGAGCVLSGLFLIFSAIALGAFGALKLLKKID